MTEPTKICPFCAETILAVAQKCKHCQSDVSAEAAAATANAKETVGTLLVGLPLLSTLLIWSWVGSMNLLQNPAGSLMLISTLTGVGSAILVAMDASSCGAGSATDLDKKGKKRWGPTAWFVFTIMFWIGAFPGWLYNRKRYGRRNLLVVGSLMAVIFLASSLTMGSAIEDKKAKIRSSLSGY